MSANGHVCPTCGSWVMPGMGHICSFTVPGPIQPTQQPLQPMYPVCRAAFSPLTADDVRKIIREEIREWWTGKKSQDSASSNATKETT